MRAAAFLLFLLLSSALTAQNRSAVVAQLTTSRLQPVKYAPDAVQPGRRIVWLEMPFASAAFISPQQVAQLRGKQIERVDLVYTQFAVSPDFNQQGLNNRRLDALQRAVSDIFSSSLTEWRLVGQTGATSPESGRTFFHGFVVVLREPASPALVRTEMRFLDSLIGGGIFSGGGSSVSGSSGTGTSVSSGTSGSGGTGLTGTVGVAIMGGKPVRIRRSIPDDSLRFYLRPAQLDGSVVEARWTDSAHTTIAYTERIMDHRLRKSITLSEDSLAALGPRSMMLSGYNRNNPDSVIISTFKRNNWQNMAVVCDVTGSMSPYSAQLFAWLSEPGMTNRCNAFLFFNDGDQKTTGQKGLGKAGGLYSVKGSGFDTVCRKAAECMNAGDGGDIPENYIEAILAVIKQFPKSAEIVVIADNWASPRDLELFQKIDRPVHFILCGSRTGVNIDYLFLARQTGGSVHTVNQDVMNLGTMQDGDFIEIGRQKFILRDERFILVTEGLMLN